jgi:hypothetical protein
MTDWNFVLCAEAGGPALQVDSPQRFWGTDSVRCALQEVHLRSSAVFRQSNERALLSALRSFWRRFAGAAAERWYDSQNQDARGSAEIPQVHQMYTHAVLFAVCSELLWVGAGTNEEKIQLVKGVRHQNQAIRTKEAFTKCASFGCFACALIALGWSASKRPARSSWKTAIRNLRWFVALLSDTVQLNSIAQMSLEAEIERIRQLPDQELLANSKGIDWHAIAVNYVSVRL